jgi:hypothetical protein
MNRLNLRGGRVTDPLGLMWFCRKEAINSAVIRCDSPHAIAAGIRPVRPWLTDALADSSKYS